MVQRDDAAGPQVARADFGPFLGGHLLVEYDNLQALAATLAAEPGTVAV